MKVHELGIVANSTVFCIFRLKGGYQNWDISHTFILKMFTKKIIHFYLVYFTYNMFVNITLNILKIYLSYQSIFVAMSHFIQKILILAQSIIHSSLIIRIISISLIFHREFTIIIAILILIIKIILIVYSESFIFFSWLIILKVILFTSTHIGEIERTLILSNRNDFAL